MTEKLFPSRHVCPADATEDGQHEGSGPVKKQKQELPIDRALKARDSVLCQHMRDVYQAFSTEELKDVWDCREYLNAGPNELALLRAIVRKALNIQIPPPPLGVPLSGTVDWWSAPRD